MKIEFNFLEVKYDFYDTNEIKKLIVYLINQEDRSLGSIVFIFTTNERILEINQKFLNHNYFTDVITFNNNIRNKIYGDIYISIDQVNYNAGLLKIDLFSELLRVIIHGVLHLIGYNDLNKESKISMRKLEDKYISIYKAKSFLKK